VADFSASYALATQFLFTKSIKRELAKVAVLNARFDQVGWDVSLNSHYANPRRQILFDLSN
jgi:hypothetical protein